MTKTTSTSSEELEATLRLATTPGVGAARMRMLLDRFGTAAAALASPGEIETMTGLGPGASEAIRRSAGPEGDARLATIERRLDGSGARAIPLRSADFPAPIAALPDAPAVLYVIGDLSLARDVDSVGIVGTRQPTGTGREVASRMGRELACAGWMVASGLARGIDAAAHAGALEVGGATVAVLGQGIDEPYPRANRRLYEQIAAEGLIISEFPPGEPARAGNFPRRNRLIAALSEAVIVVEMALRSGAQHTVNYALDQGKEVFAVPGPVTSPVSEGTNRLLRDGARAVTSASDVLADLRGLAATTAAPADAPGPVALRAAVPSLTGDAAEVYRAIDTMPSPVDDICLRTGLSAQRVLSILLDLELNGHAEALPGKRYRRI